MDEKQQDLSANVKRARFARSQHRAKQHADAHDDAGEDGSGGAGGTAVAHAIPKQANVPQGDASVVTTADGMTNLLAHLRDAGSFAYDSEFIGELTYIPKLCLVQVATAQQVALIDPLAGLDMRPFW